MSAEHHETEEIHEEDYDDDGEDAHLPEEMGDDHHELHEEEAEESAPVAEVESEVEEFIYEEVGVDSDHRVAQLRKLKHQFGGEMSLTSSSMSMEDSGPALIVCPNCNSEEISGQKFCSKCDAKLPQLPPVMQQKYNPGSIDGAARKYYDTITKFQSESISLDEFVDFLQHGLEKVRKHAENLADLSSDGVMAEWLPQASQNLSDATKLWYDSVEGMLMRVEDAQVEYEEEEALLEELDEEELHDREPLASLDERVRMIDFSPELNAIFRANDQMLEYLAEVERSRKAEAVSGGMQF